MINQEVFMDAIKKQFAKIDKGCNRRQIPYVADSQPLPSGVDNGRSLGLADLIQCDRRKCGI